MTKPGQLYWSLVEPHWERISIYDGGATFLRQFLTTPVRSRHLFAAHWCMSEVYNGGFHQFFCNSTGVLAPEAAAAFEAIGLVRLSDVVREATAFFPAPYPRDRGRRQELLDDYAHGRNADDWNPFYMLDDQFVTLCITELGGFEAAADKFAAEF